LNIHGLQAIDTTLDFASQLL